MGPAEQTIVPIPALEYRYEFLVSRELLRSSVAPINTAVLALEPFLLLAAIALLLGWLTRPGWGALWQALRLQVPPVYLYPSRCR